MIVGFGRGCGFAEQHKPTHADGDEQTVAAFKPDFEGPGVRVPLPNSWLLLSGK